MDHNIPGTSNKLNELLAKHNQKLGLRQKTYQSDEETKKMVKNLVSKNIDFESFLHEIHEHLNIRNPKSIYSLPMTNISVRTFQIYLQEEAKIIGYRWEDIAQNFCCQKVIELIRNENSDSPHLILDQNARKTVETIVLLSQQLSYILLKEFSLLEFTSYITNQPFLPLDVLWILVKHNFISLENYLIMIYSKKDTISHLTKGLAVLANGIHKEKELSSFILKDILGELVYIAFASTQSNKTLDVENATKLSVSILDTIALKLINFNVSKINLDERFNIYKLIAENKIMEVSVLQKFYYQQLLLILSHNPIWKVSQAIKEQKKWCFSQISPFMKSVLQQLLLALSAEEVISLLQNLIEQHEVSWKSLLNFVSVAVVLCKNASEFLQKLITDLLKIGLENKEFEKMIGAFLLARQACLEGTHIFPPYQTWFQVNFGDLSKSLADNKKSFLFLISFLSDLVPYETSQHLKAHIQNPPHCPAKCRLALNEYLMLAKTRLQDLKEVDNNLNEESTEKQELLEQVSSDVQKSLEQFENTGKVSTAVIEASIFRKPYFLGRFLPALLTPRLLPEKPDVKMKFIRSLQSIGKIPNQMYQDYEKACEKEQQKFELGLFSVENESGNLNKSLEDLNLSLNRLKTYMTVEIDKTSKVDYVTEQISGILHILKILIDPLNNDDSDGILLKIYSPEINLQAAKISDMLLGAFCHILAISVNSEKVNESSWAFQFTSLFAVSAELQKALYSSIWELLFHQGISLKHHHIYGLSALLTCLTYSQKLFHPYQIYVGTEENHQIYTDIVEAVAEQISIKTKPWMEFCFQLCSYYLENFYIMNFPSYLESRENEIPKNIIRKFTFLYPRFHKSFWSSSLVDEINQSSFLLCKDFHKSTFAKNLLANHKLEFKEWLDFEININPVNDCLNNFERQEYLKWFTTVYYNNNGGADCMRTFLDMILQTLLHLPQNRQFSAKQEQTEPNSFNQIIHLLQALVHEFYYRSSAIDSVPWMLDQLMLVSNSELPENVLRDQLHLFFVIAQTLPPYLLFKDRHDSDVMETTAEIIIALINSKLRYILKSEFCLSISVAEYIWKGIFQIESSSNQRIIKKLFEESPILVTSLVYHYKQLKRQISCVNKSSYCGWIFNSVDSCFDWCSSIRQQKDVHQIPQELESWIYGLVIVIEFLSCNEGRSNIRNVFLLLDKAFNKNEITNFVLFFCIIKSTCRALQLNIQIYEKTVFSETMSIISQLNYDFTTMNSLFWSSKLIKNIITEDILQFYPISCLCILFQLFEHDADILSNSTAVRVLLENYQLASSCKERKLSITILKDSSILSVEFIQNLQKKFLSYLKKIPREILISFPQDFTESFDPELRNAILRSITP